MPDDHILCHPSVHADIKRRATEVERSRQAFMRIADERTLELEQVEAELAEVKAERDAMRNKLTITQRELKRVDHECANQINEVERMLAVVEAACDLEGVVLVPFEEYDPRKIEDQSRRSAIFENAVDAFRAAQQETPDA